MRHYAPAKAAIILTCWLLQYRPDTVTAESPTSLWDQQDANEKNGKVWRYIRTEPPLGQYPNSNSQVPSSLQLQAYNNYHQPPPKKAQQVEQVEAHQMPPAINHQALEQLQQNPPIQNRGVFEGGATAGGSDSPISKNSAVMQDGQQPLNQHVRQTRQFPVMQQPFLGESASANYGYSNIPVYTFPREEEVQRGMPFVPHQTAISNDAIFPTASKSSYSLQTIPESKLSGLSWRNNAFRLPWNSEGPNQNYDVPFSDYNPFLNNYKITVADQLPKKVETGFSTNTMLNTFNEGDRLFFSRPEMSTSNRDTDRFMTQSIPSLMNTLAQNQNNQFTIDPQIPTEGQGGNNGMGTDQPPAMKYAIGNFDNTNFPQSHLTGPQFQNNADYSNYIVSRTLDDRKQNTNSQMVPDYEMSNRNYKIPLNPMLIPSSQSVMNVSVFGSPSSQMNILPIPPFSTPRDIPSIRPDDFKTQPIIQGLSIIPLINNGNLRSINLHPPPNSINGFGSPYSTDGLLLKDNHETHPAYTGEISIPSMENRKTSQDSMIQSLGTAERDEYLISNNVAARNGSWPGFTISEKSNNVNYEPNEGGFRLGNFEPPIQDAIGGNTIGRFQRLPIFAMAGNGPENSFQTKVPYFQKVRNLPYDSNLQFVPSFLPQPRYFQEAVNARPEIGQQTHSSSGHYPIPVNPIIMSSPFGVPSQTLAYDTGEEQNRKMKDFQLGIFPDYRFPSVGSETNEQPSEENIRFRFLTKPITPGSYGINHDYLYPNIQDQPNHFDHYNSESTQTRNNIYQIGNPSLQNDGGATAEHILASSRNLDETLKNLHAPELNGDDLQKTKIETEGFMKDGNEKFSAPVSESFGGIQMNGSPQTGQRYVNAIPNTIQTYSQKGFLNINKDTSPLLKERGQYKIVEDVPINSSRLGNVTDKPMNYTELQLENYRKPEGLLEASRSALGSDETIASKAFYNQNTRQTSGIGFGGRYTPNFFLEKQSDRSKGINENYVEEPIEGNPNPKMIDTTVNNLTNHTTNPNYTVSLLPESYFKNQKQLPNPSIPNPLVGDDHVTESYNRNREFTDPTDFENGLFSNKEVNVKSSGQRFFSLPAEGRTFGNWIDHQYLLNNPSSEQQQPGIPGGNNMNSGMFETQYEDKHYNGEQTTMSYLTRSDGINLWPKTLINDGFVNGMNSAMSLNQYKRPVDFMIKNRNQGRFMTGPFYELPNLQSNVKTKPLFSRVTTDYAPNQLYVNRNIADTGRALGHSAVDEYGKVSEINESPYFFLQNTRYPLYDKINAGPNNNKGVEQYPTSIDGRYDRLRSKTNFEVKHPESVPGPFQHAGLTHERNLPQDLYGDKNDEKYVDQQIQTEAALKEYDEGDPSKSYSETRSNSIDNLPQPDNLKLDQRLDKSQGQYKTSVNFPIDEPFGQKDHSIVNNTKLQVQSHLSITQGPTGQFDFEPTSITQSQIINDEYSSTDDTVYRTKMNNKDTDNTARYQEDSRLPYDRNQQSPTEYSNNTPHSKHTVSVKFMGDGANREGSKLSQDYLIQENIEGNSQAARALNGNELTNTQSPLNVDQTKRLRALTNADTGNKELIKDGESDKIHYKYDNIKLAASKYGEVEGVKFPDTSVSHNKNILQPTQSLKSEIEVSGLDTNASQMETSSNSSSRTGRPADILDGSKKPLNDLILGQRSLTDNTDDGVNSPSNPPLQNSNKFQLETSTSDELLKKSEVSNGTSVKQERGIDDFARDDGTNDVDKIYPLNARTAQYQPAEYDGDSRSSYTSEISPANDYRGTQFEERKDQPRQKELFLDQTFNSKTSKSPIIIRYQNNNGWPAQYESSIPFKTLASNEFEKIPTNAFSNPRTDNYKPRKEYKITVYDNDRSKPAKSIFGRFSDKKEILRNDRQFSPEYHDLVENATAYDAQLYRSSQFKSSSSTTSRSMIVQKFINRKTNELDFRPDVINANIMQEPTDEQRYATSPPSEPSNDNNGKIIYHDLTFGDRQYTNFFSHHSKDERFYNENQSIPFEVTNKILNISDSTLDVPGSSQVQTQINEPDVRMKLNSKYRTSKDPLSTFTVSFQSTSQTYPDSKFVNSNGIAEGQRHLTYSFPEITSGNSLIYKHYGLGDPQMTEQSASLNSGTPSNLIVDTDNNANLNEPQKKLGRVHIKILPNDQTHFNNLLTQQEDKTDSTSDFQTDGLRYKPNEGSYNTTPNKLTVSQYGNLQSRFSEPTVEESETMLQLSSSPKSIIRNRTVDEMNYWKHEPQLLPEFIRKIMSERNFTISTEYPGLTKPFTEESGNRASDPATQYHYTAGNVQMEVPMERENTDSSTQVPVGEDQYSNPGVNEDRQNNMKNAMRSLDRQNFNNRNLNNEEGTAPLSITHSSEFLDKYTDQEYRYQHKIDERLPTNSSSFPKQFYSYGHSLNAEDQGTSDKNEPVVRNLAGADNTKTESSGDGLVYSLMGGVDTSKKNQMPVVNAQTRSFFSPNSLPTSQNQGSTNIQNGEFKANQLDSPYLLASKSGDIERPLAYKLISRSQTETNGAPTETLVEINTGRYVTTSTHATAENTISKESTKSQDMSSLGKDLLLSSNIPVQRGYNNYEGTYPKQTTGANGLDDYDANHLKNTRGDEEINHGVLPRTDGLVRSDMNEGASSTSRSVILTRFGWETVQESTPIISAQNFQEVKDFESSLRSQNEVTMEQETTDRFTNDINLKGLSRGGRSGQGETGSIKRDDNNDKYEESLALDSDTSNASLTSSKYRSDQEFPNDNIQSNKSDVTMTRTGWKVRQHPYQQLEAERLARPGEESRIIGHIYSDEQPALIENYNQEHPSGPKSNEMVQTVDRIGKEAIPEFLVSNPQLISQTKSLSSSDLGRNDQETFNALSPKTYVYSGERALGEEVGDDNLLPSQKKDGINDPTMMSGETLTKSTFPNSKSENHPGEAIQKPTTINVSAQIGKVPCKNFSKTPAYYGQRSLGDELEENTDTPLNLPNYQDKVLEVPLESPPADTIASSGRLESRSEEKSQSIPSSITTAQLLKSLDALETKNLPSETQAYHGSDITGQKMEGEKYLSTTSVNQNTMEPTLEISVKSTNGYGENTLGALSSSSTVKTENSIDILEQIDEGHKNVIPKPLIYSGQRTLGDEADEETNPKTESSKYNERNLEQSTVTLGESSTDNIALNSRSGSDKNEAVQRPSDSSELLKSESFTSKPSKLQPQPQELIGNETDNTAIKSPNLDDETLIQTSATLGNPPTDPSSTINSNSEQHTPYGLNLGPITSENSGVDEKEYQHALRTLQNINSGNFKIFSSDYFIQLIRRCNCASLKFLIPILQNPNSGILVTS